MHTLQLTNDQNKPYCHDNIPSTVFNYNGDYSGDVRIYHNGIEMWIPFWQVLYFVAEYTRSVKISQIENATPHELFDIPKD